jgi:hypothetical protein
MAIAKKPDRNRSAVAAHPESDRAAEAFITGAEGATPEKHEKKVPILVRFDREMLQRVDAAAKRRGISRSAWIHFMVSRALEQDEG